MDPEICAAWINAGGTVLAAALVLGGGFFGIRHEIRHRQRADHRRELFIAAVQDCAGFVREMRQISHSMARISFDIMHNPHADPLVIIGRVDEAMATFGFAGSLVPPELTERRDAVWDAALALRVQLMDQGPREKRILPNEAAGKVVNEAMDAFITDFEAWKQAHWEAK